MTPPDYRTQIQRDRAEMGRKYRESLPPEHPLHLEPLKRGRSESEERLLRDAGVRVLSPEERMKREEERRSTRRKAVLITERSRR